MRFGNPSLTTGEQVELRGWVADPVAADAAGGLFIIIDDSKRIRLFEPVRAGTTRRGGVLKNPHLTNTGFVVDVPALALHPGVNQLQLGVISSDQRGFFKFPDRVTVTLAEQKS